MRDATGFDHERPWSVDCDSMIPFRVRASIHSDLSFFSTIMCSCQSGFGNVLTPRRSHVAPSSVETNTFAPRSGSSSRKQPWNARKPGRWSSEIGNIHSPVESTVGLLSVTPCQIRRGFDHVGSWSSGFSQTVAQTPARPSNMSIDWSKMSQSRPLPNIK